MLSSIKKKILSNEEKWCDILKLHNPYSDNWNTLISKKVPDFDIQAYRRYKKYKFVYDKLWVAQSQGIECGTLESLKNEDKLPEFPIFIKPRWGHKTSSSKNCFKIKDENELSKYLDKINDMMWSEYVAEKEQMTDFMLQQGQIMHQITYVYSSEQNGSIADEWKYIGPDSRPPQAINTWISNHLSGFTGVCNIQYRGEKIIEVGLRLARGGAYIYCTHNELLIRNINDLVETGNWNYLSHEELAFTPFYSFKCYISLPVVYIYPQYVMDTIMKLGGCMNFYEYYFEPSGNIGMVGFQFMKRDYNKGMMIKRVVETLLNFAQIFFYLMIVLLAIVYVFKRKYFFTIGFVVLFMYLSRILNPLSIHNNLLNAQKQMFFS